ncbi:MAG TPA: histidine kinase [Bacteroidales bacterium]|nr:histidine kinase [Bacteroidales bacterium]
MKKTHTILLHIGLWVLILIPTILFFLFNEQHIPPQRFWFSIVSFAFTLINFYFFYSFLIPVFYKNKKSIYLLLGLTFLFVLIYPWLQHKVFSLLINIFDWDFKGVRHRAWFFPESYTVTLLYTGLAYLARFTTRWIMDQQVKAELINRNQQSELALLRSQINPHFLFNTLNNIYSLVYTKSDDAPQAMTKLSDIMRYMLYEANTEKVLLSREINHLRGYIELLLLRVSKKNFIEFDVQGDTENKLISPMLLFPFVENAYKHCNKKSPVPGIKIALKVQEDLLTFTVVNSVKKETDISDNDEGGIGLKNIRRRLDLLYPDRHQLIISETAASYSIELRINLR